MNKYEGKLMAIVFTPLISTYMYCRVFNRNIIFSWYRPCYIMWMGVTYVYLYKNISNF